MVRGFRKTPSHIPHRTTMSWKAATMASCHQHKSNKTRVNSAPLKTCPVTGREYLCSKNMRLPPPVQGYSKNHSQSPILSVYNEETMAGRSGVIGPRSPSSLESK